MSATNRSSSRRPTDTLRCLNRCCLRTRHARRSETFNSPQTRSMQARRRAGLKVSARLGACTIYRIVHHCVNRFKLPSRLTPRSACPASDQKQLCEAAHSLSETASVPSISQCRFRRTCLAVIPSTGRFSLSTCIRAVMGLFSPANLPDRIQSRIPCAVSFSIFRNFVTISSGLGRLLAMRFLRFTKHSGGPLQWGTTTLVQQRDRMDRLRQRWSILFAPK
jgi:hypothetical protein